MRPRHARVHVCDVRRVRQSGGGQSTGPRVCVRACAHALPRPWECRPCVCACDGVTATLRACASVECAAAARCAVHTHTCAPERARSCVALVASTAGRRGAAVGASVPVRARMRRVRAPAQVCVCACPTRACAPARVGAHPLLRVCVRTWAPAVRACTSAGRQGARARGRHVRIHMHRRAIVRAHVCVRAPGRHPDAQLLRPQPRHQVRACVRRPHALARVVARRNGTAAVCHACRVVCLSSLALWGPRGARSAIARQTPARARPCPVARTHTHARARAHGCCCTQTRRWAYCAHVSTAHRDCV